MASPVLMWVERRWRRACIRTITAFLMIVTTGLLHTLAALLDVLATMARRPAAG